MIDKKTEETINKKVDEIVSKTNTDINTEITKLRDMGRLERQAADSEFDPTDLSWLFDKPHICIKIADLACSAAIALEAVAREIPKPAGDVRKDIIYMRLINKITNQQAALLHQINQIAQLLSVQTDNLSIRLKS